VPRGRAAGLDHRRNVGGFADIGAMRRGIAAFVGDDLRCRRGGGLIDIGTEYFCPLAREGDCGRLAVAPAGTDRSGADDQRHLALEPVGHVSPPQGLPCLASSVRSSVLRILP
jgi:hypothetical protein